jgi:hypothetical protein
MSHTFIAYWSAFARTGDVNSAVQERGERGERAAKASTLKWPIFDDTTRLNMRMASSTGATCDNACNLRLGICIGSCGGACGM